MSPRDVVAACLPDPAELGDRMHGVTCAGTMVDGIGKDGAPREVYLHHVVDNEWSMAEYGSQAVVWQAALNPVLALELLASGAWAGAGVLGPRRSRRTRSSTWSQAAVRRGTWRTERRRSRLAPIARRAGTAGLSRVSGAAMRGRTTRERAARERRSRGPQARRGSPDRARIPGAGADRAAVRRLDAFGEHRHVEFVAERDDRLEQRVVLRASRARDARTTGRS